MSRSRIACLALEAAGIGWLRVAVDGRIRAANAVCAPLFACSDAESLQSAVRAGTLRLPAALSGQLGLARTAGTTAPLTFLFNAGDGEFAATVTVISGARASDLLLHPITEAHPLCAGEQINAFERSEHGVCISDGRHVLYANPAFADTLGYQPAELAGMPCMELVERTQGERFSLLQRQMLDVVPGDTNHMGSVSGCLRTRDGRQRDVLAHASRVRFESHVAVLWVVFDVTRLRRGESALRNYANRLRLLSRQVIDVQENERRLLARELHDEVGQQLTLVKLSLEAVRDGANGKTLEEALAAVTQLTQQVREMSLDLRPSMLDDLGLAAALRWYAQRAARFANIELSVELPPVFPRLRTDVETLYFRVAQEAITNAVRHAAASRLTLELQLDEREVRLRIADDGRGFDPAAARDAALRGDSGGLLGMEERAGLAGAELQVESRPNAGTAVTLSLPLSSAGMRAISA